MRGLLLDKALTLTLSQREREKRKRYVIEVEASGDGEIKRQVSKRPALLNWIPAFAGMTDYMSYFAAALV